MYYVFDGGRQRNWFQSAKKINWTQSERMRFGFGWIVNGLHIHSFSFRFILLRLCMWFNCSKKNLKQSKEGQWNRDILYIFKNRFLFPSSYWCYCCWLLDVVRFHFIFNELQFQMTNIVIKMIVKWNIEIQCTVAVSVTGLFLYYYYIISQLIKIVFEQWI